MTKPQLIKMVLAKQTAVLAARDATHSKAIEAWNARLAKELGLDVLAQDLQDALDGAYNRLKDWQTMHQNRVTMRSEYSYYSLPRALRDLVSGEEVLHKLRRDTFDDTTPERITLRDTYNRDVVEINKNYSAVVENVRQLSGAKAAEYLSDLGFTLEEEIKPVTALVVPVDVRWLSL